MGTPADVVKTRIMCQPVDPSTGRYDFSAKYIIILKNIVSFCIEEPYIDLLGIV
jgi:hypothetical protein